LICEIVLSRLEDLEAFLSVVDHGSLTEAAVQLGRSLQAISRSLASVEEDIGVVLIHRTTRHCQPSEAGAVFYERIKPAIGEIREAREQVANRRSEPSGVLRVGAPILFGPDFLVPIIAEYMTSFPQTEIDLQLSDEFSDLATEKLDLVIRIADLPDSGLQSRQLGSLRRVVFGAPSYFAKSGWPGHPRDLRHHNCLVRTVDRQPGQWSFQIDGRVRLIKVQGSFRSNSMTAIYSAASSGLGLGYSPLWQINHLVATSKVQLVLENFEPKPVPIHALWQEHRLAPAKVRAFIDLLALRLKLNGL
jgi:DNA-binding transcriptional LysR family regulator